MAQADAYGATLAVSSVPDRATGEAAVRDKSVDGLLVVPADLSAPGVLVVRERADDQLQAITTGAVIALRAAGVQERLVPPSVTALEPRRPRTPRR